MKKILTSIAVGAITLVAWAYSQNNIAEEVAWVVGDQPIYKSEIEETYQQMQYERTQIKGDPYCYIPEQMAIEKLFLHQAELDTVEVADAMVMNEVESRLNYLVNNLGSKEKVESYFHKSFPEIREQMIEMRRNNYKIQEVQRSLTKNLKSTPSDVRRYFDALPEDSIPFVPMQVETQIITINPVIPPQEIEDVKARLRDFTERVNKGESSFSTLAILYSEDRASASRGGELGFMSKAQLVPEFAAVAFNLNEPDKVSKIVETQYGYHIIQLIEKRGERVNARHILLKPKVSNEELTNAINRLDSLRTDMVDAKKFTFEEAAPYVSQDKDTRNNRGIMVNEATGTLRFEMSQLPQEIGRVVDTMAVGSVSKPFIMIDPKSAKEIVAIVKLTDRIEPHKANLADDFQLIKSMQEAAQKQQVIDKWIERKIRSTYVRIEDGWRDCEFEHKGWLKK